MAAVPGNGFVDYPSGVRVSLGNVASTTPGNANILLDAADEACAQGFIAPKTGNIDRIKFRTNTVTTGCSLQCALEAAAAATGMPAFTQALLGTNTNVNLTVNNSDDNVWLEATLTAAAAVTADDLFNLVLRNPNSSPGTLNIAARPTSGSIPFYNSSSLRVRASEALGAPPTAFADKNQQHLMCAVRYDDGTWWTPDGTYIFGTGGVTAYNSGSATNRRGVRFKLAAKKRAAGGWACINNPAANSDYYLRLYDDSGTQLATSALVDGDHLNGTTTDGWVPSRFTTPVVLDANTWYRLAVVPNSANNISLAYVDVENADIMSATPGGTNWYRTLYTSGAWVDTGTTSRESVLLMCDQEDDGSGGGGGMKTHPGMAGGMRG